MSAAPRGDLLARIIGMVVFLVGVGVILEVLLLAFQMFRDPTMGIHAPGAPGASATAADLGVGFVRLILRIALLLVGSISGSLIANKGSNLYFASLPSRDGEKRT